MPETVLDDREPMTAEREESFRELLARLASGSAALVRDEIDLVRQELTEKIKSWRSAIIALTIALLVGGLALMSLCAAAIAGLSPIMGTALSALVVGVVLALIAGMVMMGALRLLKRTGLKPEQTIQTLKEDKEWLKNMT
jgi:uncharacterized membrane protein YqjE